MSLLAEFPKLTPYVIEEIISNDSFYTNYRATATHLEEEQSYIITEFNPSFMVRRTEEGVLEPTERFVMEFETALDRFTKLGEAMVSLGEPFIVPIQELLQLNNTVYVVRQMSGSGRYKELDEGLGTDKMNYNDAYVMLRPLIQSLMVAWKRRLLFQFQPGSVFVNPYKQLVVDSMFAWEGDHRNTIKELTKLFYRLISGVEYNPSFPDNPSIEALGFPPRLNAFIREILTDEPSFGSIDDFSRQFRSIMDMEGDKEIVSGKPIGDESKPKTPITVNKKAALGVIGGVSAAVILLIVAPLLWIFVFNQNVEDDDYTDLVYGYVQYDGYDEQEGEVAEEIVIPGPGTQAAFVRHHTGYAVTDPRDPTIMLNGSFYIDGQASYRRAYRGGYGLIRQVGNSEMVLIASGVRPAFITSHGGFIYFSDGSADYNIRRVRADGSGDVETVSTDTASFLHIYGDSLFYTNHSNRDFLYRMDLNTMQSQPFLRLAAYEPVVSDGLLYFINGNSNFNIYVIPVNAPEDEPVSVNRANSSNIRVSGGHIFYRNVEDNTIGRIAPLFSSSLPIPPSAPMPVASFDILGNVIAIIEARNSQLLFYDMQSGEILTTGVFASYATVDSTRQGEQFAAYVIERDVSGNIYRIAMLYQIDEYEEEYEYDEESL